MRDPRDRHDQMAHLEPSDPGRLVRYFAAAASIVTAVLYGLIGLHVLDVGTAANATAAETSGEAPDIFVFGALMTVVFLVTAALLLRFRSRALWVAVAILQVLVIVGYFAVSTIRVPPIEINRLLVKGCQAAILGSVAWLLVQVHPATSTGPARRGSGLHLG